MADDQAAYDRAYDDDSSYGSAVRLVAASERTGVVLDLGCGYGPVAEPLRDLGLIYVGLDLDEDGLADLRTRGFEAASLDLEATVDELVAAMQGQLGDRPLAAVLALDALEHVRDPAACVAAIAQLVAPHPGALLVLSLPNVTHVDVAGKLLLGRWDIRTTGLLDYTHVQFFDEGRAISLATDRGFAAVGADDVQLGVTEQCDPADAPQLRPGSPLNDFLRSVRGDADAHGQTYQFVRSYVLPADAMTTESVVPGPLPAPAAAFATVVVQVPVDELPQVAADLAGQSERSFRVVLVAEADVPASFAADAGVEAGDVVVVAEAALVDDALDVAGGRYVCHITTGERVGPSWVQQFAIAADDAPGRVLVAGCDGPDGKPLDVARFDVAGRGLVGVVPPVAYAVPRAAVAAGLLHHGEQAAHALAGLAEASLWCGRYDLDERTCSAVDPLDLAHLDVAVARVLDEQPLLLAAGAAAPLVALQRELAGARARADQAAWALHELRVHHDAYIAASDAERDQLHRKVAATATPLGLAKVTARRAASVVKRRLLRR